jgi:signal transduction histidine kinase
MSEILRVISTSPTDLQAVFDAIVSNAVRICGASHGGVYRFDGRLVHSVAHAGYTPEQLEDWRKTWPRPVTAPSAACQAIRTQTLFQLTDVENPSESVKLTPATLANLRARRSRSIVAVPMLWREEVIGAISVAHHEVNGFSDRDIELLTTFADQAVIAIENARLFAELQDKARALAEAHAQTTEAFEQQTATAEILRIISSSPTDVQPVFDAIVAGAQALSGTGTSAVFRVRDDVITVAAADGVSPAWRAQYPRAITPDTVMGRAIIERRTLHVEDFATDPTYETAPGRLIGVGTILGVPMLKDGEPVGVIAVWRWEVKPFSTQQIVLLETFADQAVIAIKNVRLFTELQEKNRALTDAHEEVTEALERQTATSEILRTINQNHLDVEPVFEAIADSAMRLLGAWATAVGRYDGELFSMVSARGGSPGSGDAAKERLQSPHRPTSPPELPVLTKTVHHVIDVETDSSCSLEFRRHAVARGFRSFVAVPMLRGDEPLGIIAVSRAEAGGFSAAQIALLQTFADQAVIAIENVRLFTELQEKNRALTQAYGQVTEALEQQTATGDILRTIAQVQTDIQPVFDTIVQNAARLCQAFAAAVFVTDGGMLYEPANYGSSSEARAATRARFPRPVDMDTTAGMAVLTRSIVHVPDTEDPSAVAHVQQSGRVHGFRSCVTMPMLRDNEAVGAILVARREPGRFSDSELTLLQTFADQAVIAIENVRLFKELESSNRQLEAASQHKSEFLANMSHELRTPLNAIIGFSEVLSERMFGELNEKQEEYLEDIHASGLHLLSLINDILDLSKIEAGRMELEPTDFHLPTALDNALTLVRERAGQRGIALHSTVDGRLDQVRADERKIRQVVLNLLSNAIKFTPEGGRIEVRAAPVDGAVKVSVADTGVGIAPEDQDAVFEEFRQVGTADKKVEGTGLGLTLCRKFIELHGGRIWVTSQVGTGSTFTFTIPVGRGE